MNDALERRYFRLIRALPLWIGCLVIIMGLFVLIGWIFEIRLFVEIIPDFATMKVNTAILFIVAGCILTFASEHPRGYLVGGWIISLVALLSLSEYVLNLNYGIDELFIRDDFSRALGESYPGRMSPATSISFLIFGVGAIALFYQKHLAEYSAIILFLLTTLVLMGYLYNFAELYEVFLFSTMALHTSIGFFLLAIGLILSIPSNPIIALFTRSDSGGHIMRRLIPAIVIVFIIIGFLGNLGTRLELYGPAIGLALSIVFNLIITLFVVWWTARDIQDMEKDLRSTQRRLQLVLEQASQGILLVDAGGAIIEVNAYIEEVFQWSRKELVGQLVDMLLPQDSRQVHQHLRGDYMKSPVTRPMGYNRDLTALRADQTVFPVEVSLCPIIVDGTTYVVVFLIDITERLELAKQHRRVFELELEIEKERELQALKNRFVANVSHEFRTPLTIISSSLQIIKDYREKMSSADINSKIATALEQVNRMSSMIMDVLDLSKLQARAANLDVEAIKVAAFVQNIAQDEMLVYKKDHHIELDISDGDLIADPTLIKHVLSNLIGNALKYSPPRSTVSIRAAQQNNGWDFVIQDEGIGIPAEDIEYLCDPFYRAKNAKNEQGTGLGLSIVKNYVERHNGRVIISSVEGKGTTVHVEIPEQSANN